MKKLVGTWLAVGEDGKPTDEVVSVIKVTAGGTAVHETLFPGSHTKWFRSIRPRDRTW